MRRTKSKQTLKDLMYALLVWLVALLIAYMVIGAVHLLIWLLGG